MHRTGRVKFTQKVTDKIRKPIKDFPPPSQNLRSNFIWKKDEKKKWKEVYQEIINQENERKSSCKYRYQKESSYSDRKGEK